MINNFSYILHNFYETNILTYIQNLQEHPIKLISLILDLLIVIFLAYQLDE